MTDEEAPGAASSVRTSARWQRRTRPAGHNTDEHAPTAVDQNRFGPRKGSHVTITPTKHAGYGGGVEYHHGTRLPMPKTKTNETDRRPPADDVAPAGTPPDDLAHEIDLLGAALRLTPEQRAAARLSAAAVSSKPAGDR